MIKAFIHIRIKQIYRELGALGFVRTIFVTGLLLFLLFVLFKQSEVLPNAYYVLGISTGLILITHLKRPDSLFLKIHFDNYKVICFIEYLILLLPVFICFIYHSQWLPAILLVSFPGLIIHFDYQPKKHNLNTKIQEWIPDSSFEWKAGIRQSFYYLIPLWIVGLGTSFFIGSVPIVIFILGIIPLSFYEKGEPYQMILAYEMNTNRFLFRKIRNQFLLFSVITAPLIISFLIFHQSKWYIVAGEYLIFFFLHIFLILTKYAFYEPNGKSPASTTFGAVGAVAAIIPVFLPLVWVLTFWFYFKSINNLKQYLDDYN